jgi:predicted ATPase
MIYLHGLSGYAIKNADAYYSHIPSLSKLDRMDFTTPITFFVGENGSGKSTLLEAIAKRFDINAEGGSKDYLFKTRDTTSDMEDYITFNISGYPRPADTFFLRAESFYNLATYVEDPEVNALRRLGGKSLHAQSHGESFLATITNRFQWNGFYLLDEPEAALSPQRQLSLLTEFRRLENSESQLIIATHSPILLAYPGATIYQFSEDGIHQVDYHDTEAYQVTKMFLDNPDRMLHHLFDDYSK